jgi:hypothetical protein
MLKLMSVISLMLAPVIMHFWRPDLAGSMGQAHQGLTIVPAPSSFLHIASVPQS